MSTLHIGTLAGNTTVNDVNKYADYEVQVKDLMEEIAKQDKKDTFELQKRAMMSISECYPNYNVISSMPKSTFSDTFGYDMQKDISNHMTDFYAGKISQEELDSYFEECCISMRIYRTQQRQTTGANEADNTQIVSEMYEIFVKENARAARQANYQEGKELNQSMYQDNSGDWTYHNADYYYKCSETNTALRESAQKMAEKWELDNIDCQAIEDNSCYTIDGGFDFNSGWNFSFRNQTGRSSIASEDSIPPEGFKMFFKEQITDYTVDNQFDGYLKITLGNEEVKNFMSNLSVFTRWYAYQTGINNKTGDFAV